MKKGVTGRGTHQTEETVSAKALGHRNSEHLELTCPSVGER